MTLRARPLMLSALCAVVPAAVLLWLAGTPRYTQREILDAIRQVESSGRDHPPDGDGGKAIGPFQIHERYWRDAVAAEPDLKTGRGYQACRERAYAERVVAAYMARWVPVAWSSGDAEVVARTHNGGPDGATREATTGYWTKVQGALRSGR